MATRQAPVPGVPFPGLVSETGTRQVPSASAVLINETVSISPPPAITLAPQVFVAT